MDRIDNLIGPRQAFPRFGVHPEAADEVRRVLHYFVNPRPGKVGYLLVRREYIDLLCFWMLVRKPKRLPDVILGGPALTGLLEGLPSVLIVERLLQELPLAVKSFADEIELAVIGKPLKAVVPALELGVVLCPYTRAMFDVVFQYLVRREVA
jgi:hypothetical protein